MKPLITKAPKRPTVKPKLVSRPKPKTTAEPAPTTIAASTNGPLHQIPPESPTLPPPEEPIQPESPTTEATKVTGYGVIESEVTLPTTELADASVPTGYIVVESDDTPPAPSVPTVMVPPSQALEDISSIQLGDVLIIAVRVQPAPPPEAES